MYLQVSSAVIGDDECLSLDLLQEHKSMQNRNDLPHPSTLCSKKRKKEKPPTKRRGGVDLGQLLAQLKSKQANW